MKRTLPLLLKSLATLVLGLAFMACGDGNTPTPEPEPTPTPTPTPTPKPDPDPKPGEVTIIELPEGASISVDDVKIFENGGEQVKVDSEGRFNTSANTLLALGKEDRIMYISYLSTDTIASEKKVVLNSLETASSLLLHIFPTVFTPTSTANFEAFKNLIAELEEAKQLATAIDKSIVRNGYLNLDDVKGEYSVAKEKIIELTGLRDNYLSPTALQNSQATTRTATTPNPPIIKNNSYKGIRLDIESSKYIAETNKWHCEMTAYSDRFAFVALIHAYAGNDGLIYPYSGDFWDQMKFILPPMNVSTFMGKTTSWKGIKDFFSDTWKLISKKDYGFGDLTWDKSKLEDIYMDFRSPNDGVYVATPQSNYYLLVFNTTMACLSPAISLIAGEVGSSKSFSKDLTYKFVYKLTTDPTFANEIRAIVNNSSLSIPDRSLKVAVKLCGEFADFIRDDAINLFPDLAKKFAGKAFKNAIMGPGYLQKIVEMVGDGYAAYLGIVHEQSIFFNMQLDFGDTNVLELDTSLIKETLEKGKTSVVNIKVTRGNAEKVEVTDTDIATAEVTNNGKDIEVTLKKAGTTELIVFNGTKKVEVPIEVSKPKDPTVIYPNGMVVEGTILKKWPCEAIPADGYITVPKGITVIGEKAFYQCYSLKSVTLPNSVTTIKNNAFAHCKNLTSISIPNSVTSIEEYTFRNCSSLTNISIPNAATIIREGTFRNCSSLTSIKIPTSVKNIDHRAFYGCSSLKSITIPNSVTTIGDGVFANCSSLATIDIPNSVTIIGGRVFDGCTSLKSITLPNKVTKINEGTFSNCSSLTSITIPNTVITIGEYAFYKCTNLKSITIPNSVLAINKGALSECSSLSGITLPNSLSYVGENVFEGSKNLKEVICKATTPPDAGGNLGYTGKLIVPKGSKQLYQKTYAWNYCSPILEENEQIEELALDTSAIKITLEKGKNSVVNINVIKGTAQKAVVANTTIATAEVFNNGKLIKVRPKKAGTTKLTVTNGSKTVEVPIEVTTKEDPTDIYPKGVVVEGTVLVKWACEAVPAHGQVTIPKGITEIGFGAFKDCTRLKSVNIPNSVTTVGRDAFMGCNNLGSITFPSSVTSIGISSFSGCSKLASVSIPNSVKTIGAWAFAHCVSLTSISIPNSVTTMEDGVFDDCQKLAQIDLSNSLTALNWRTFRDCYSLTSITIPKSVTRVGGNVFENCKKLNEIKCNPTTPPNANYFGYTGKLIVPKGTKKLYQQASVWKDCSPILEEGESEEVKPKEGDGNGETPIIDGEDVFKKK